MLLQSPDKISKTLEMNSLYVSYTNRKYDENFNKHRQSNFFNKVFYFIYRLYVYIFCTFRLEDGFEESKYLLLVLPAPLMTDSTSAGFL